jgi:NAD(P)H-hydrate repair Nnr-like enzyme with NAD(P)H-hydrate dehydratase domain
MQELIANSYVVGPGLGRAQDSFDRINNFVLSLHKTLNKKVVVLDADALWWVKESK